MRCGTVRLCQVNPLGIIETYSSMQLIHSPSNDTIARRQGPHHATLLAALQCDRVRRNVRRRQALNLPDDS